MSLLIQKLRLQRGWSQQQLADFAGLSVRTVQRIEGGQKATAESLKSLAAVFEVEFQELRAAVEGTEPSAAPPVSSPVPQPDPEPPAMTPSATPTFDPPLPPQPRPPGTHRDHEARLGMSDEEVRALRHVRKLRGFYIHLMIYLLVITGLVILNLWRTPQRLWVFGPAFGWGIGILAHGLSVFGGGRLFGPEWERKQVEKQLGRKLGLALGVLASGVMAGGWANDASAAGFRHFEVPDADGPIEVAVWYPSADAPRSIKMGPIEQTVAVGATVRGDVRGERLPLVVFSHGTGGSTLGHFDTAIALADAGFVVAALAHPGDNYTLHRDVHREGASVGAG